MSTPGFHPNRGSVKPVVVLASIAKWEIRIRSGPNEQTSKIEGQRLSEG
jgi:hypothetical protein